jgi:hypothetical protein
LPAGPCNSRGYVPLPLSKDLPFSEHYLADSFIDFITVIIVIANDGSFLFLRVRGARVFAIAVFLQCRIAGLYVNQVSVHHNEAPGFNPPANCFAIHT